MNRQKIKERPGNAQTEIIHRRINELKGAVAERKEEKNRLVECEDGYRYLFEESPIGIGLTSLDGNVVNCNKAMEAITGYSGEELKHINLTDTYAYPGDRKVLLEMINQQGRVVNYPVQLKRKDGSVHDAILSMVPIRLNGESVIQTTCIDITDRKQVDESLKESRKRFRDLVNLLPQSVWEVDRQGNFTFVNRHGFESYGYKSEEIEEPLNSAQMFVAEDRDRLSENIRRLLHGEKLGGIEYTALRKDGSTFPILVYVAPIMEGREVTGFRGVTIDITEQKQKEEETNRLLETIETAREAVCITTEGAIIVYTNRAMDELFAYTKGELIGKHTSTLYAGSDALAVGKMIRDAIKKQGYWEGEVIKKRKDGTRFLSYARVSVFRDKSGNIVNFLSTQHDVTEQRRVEKELAEYRNHLEELVEQRTAELAKASQQLKAEITERQKAEERIKELYQREKGLRKELEKEINTRVELTRGLIHELKTPLTPMLGSSELLIDRIQDEGLLRIAKNINRGIRNLNNRINDLMDLARAEIGRLQLRYLNVDIQQMLHEVVDYLAPAAEKKEQQLTLEIPSSLPMINADEDRLRQIILNIVNNAMKFTPMKGKINLKAEVMDSQLIVEVKDNGCGITMKDQKNLFQPHYTMQTNGEELSGLGIGLPLCKMLVELHGGGIWVSSRRGQGSTFSFSIPLR